MLSDWVCCRGFRPGEWRTLAEAVRNGQTQEHEQLLAEIRRPAVLANAEADSEQLCRADGRGSRRRQQRGPVVVVVVAVVVVVVLVLVVVEVGGCSSTTCDT